MRQRLPQVILAALNSQLSAAAVTLILTPALIPTPTQVLDRTVHQKVRDPTHPGPMIQGMAGDENVRREAQGPVVGALQRAHQMMTESVVEHDGSKRYIS